MFVQYGVEIDLPAATILSLFGLRAQVRYLQCCLERLLMES